MIIRKACDADKEGIKRIRPIVIENMVKMGLTQWDEQYPSEDILMGDLDRGEMYVALIEKIVVGYVTVNKDIPEEYKDIPLEFGAEMCIHRLSVDPNFAKRGIATKIMNFVHEDLKAQGYKSICLDTCEDNKGALKLYSNLGYITRGYVKFERKEKYKFPVMERML